MKITKIKPATKDERGDISDIFYKHPVEHVAIINSKKGVFRGDHYHKFTTQHMYMTKGSLRYYYRNVNEGNDKVRSTVVKQGEMVSTPPNEVHALEILNDNQFIVFSEGLRGGRDYESDTFRITPSLIKKKEKSLLK